jgi:hypothetical protein
MTEAAVTGAALSKETNATLEAAIECHVKGWAVVPIPLGKKAPTIKGWTDLRLDTAKIAEIFGKQRLNMGVLLGTPSGNLVDIDLDCPEAVALAHHFLPPTKAIFGHRSNPKSHYLYIVEPGVHRTVQLHDDSNGTLVELRGDGAQTVIPPSVHPTGEQVSWDSSGDPSRVTHAELLASCRRLAAAALLARHWPSDGRHELSLAVAGVLARAGIRPDESRSFLAAVCEGGGDPKEADRLRSPQYADARLAAGDPTFGLPKIAAILGGAVAKSLAQLLDIPAERSQKSAERDRLFKLGSSVELWTSPDTIAFATIEIDGHLENLRLKSKRFRQWLTTKMIEDTQRVPSRAAIDEAVDAFEAQALQGKSYEPAIRVAGHENCIYIDLCDQRWRAIEIDRAGWRIVDRCPVKFTRSRGMLEQPVPVRGRVDELRPFVNVASDRDFVLFVGFIIAALLPDRPYPILVCAGEQGTAKTTLAKVARTLIDPNSASTRAMSRNEHDLFISAASGWVLSFDNVSYIPPAMADALCRIATGGGFATRELYSDLEETLIQVRRPIMLNGIPLVAERPDLMDRSIILTLPVIKKTKRRPESEFWRAFDASRPRILGAICDAISGVLANAEHVKLEELPRMSDLALDMTAAEQSLGWSPGTFVRAYEENQRTALTEVAANDPLVLAISSLLHEESKPIKLPASRLLFRLDTSLPPSERPRHSWPKGANQLTKTLRRMAPAMRALGIEVTLDQERDPVSNVKLIELSFSDGKYGQRF